MSIYSTKKYFKYKEFRVFIQSAPNVLIDHIQIDSEQSQGVIYLNADTITLIKFHLESYDKLDRISTGKVLINFTPWEKQYHTREDDYLYTVTMKVFDRLILLYSNESALVFRKDEFKHLLNRIGREISKIYAEAKKHRHPKGYIWHNEVGLI